MIEESDDTLTESLEHGVAHRTENFRARFNWPTSAMSLQVLPAIEPTKVDTSPSSEMEVMKELGFLKKYKEASAKALTS